MSVTDLMASANIWNHMYNDESADVMIHSSLNKSLITSFRPQFSLRDVKDIWKQLQPLIVKLVECNCFQLAGGHYEVDDNDEDDLLHHFFKQYYVIGTSDYKNTPRD